jgi:hypothetical protein
MTIGRKARKTFTRAYGDTRVATYNPIMVSGFYHRALRTAAARPRDGGGVGVRDAPNLSAYWAIRLFCSTFTRLSVQKVQFAP